MERIYLDMCSLERPFDDQRQPRVREEATAVAAIVARAEAAKIALVRSPAHLVENDANGLVALGIRPLDALHLAFAERAGTRWFVTCDDELLELAGRLGDALRTLVVAPRALARENES